MVVPAADLTLRSFFGVTLHTLTVESAKPPAIKLESSVTSTPVRPCSSPGVNFFHFLKKCCFWVFCRRGNNLAMLHCKLDTGGGDTNRGNASYLTCDGVNPVRLWHVLFLCLSEVYKVLS